MIQVLAVAEQMKHCVFCKRCSATIFCTGGPLNPKDLACDPNIFYGGSGLYSLQCIICVVILTLCQVIAVCQKGELSAYTCKCRSEGIPLIVRQHHCHHQMSGHIL